MPIGVPGELYIGGAGLARGYLNRPELTAEKFVSNPFSDDPTARLYRTGDLCRWRADGNLEYLGRIDNQVKLRGFRIELGEIENVLNAHAKIKQCVVMLREDRAGDKRLVAYCVPAEGKLHVSELRSYLQGRLPDYMLPSSFVELTSFPLTSSGKLDRRSLPAPDDSRPDLESGYVAPRNPLEEQLASIWGELLGLQAIGVHDNFFALGGHSLLAARMIDMIDREFSCRLKLMMVFRSPTIAGMATALESYLKDASELYPMDGHFLSVLQEGCEEGTVVLIGGHVSQQLPKLPKEFTVLHLALDGLQVEPFLGLSMTAVADAYLDEILAAKVSPPFVLVGHSYGGLLAYALAHRWFERQVGEFQLLMIEPSAYTLMRKRRNSASSAIDKVTQIMREPRTILMRSQSVIGKFDRFFRRKGTLAWTNLQLALGQTAPQQSMREYYSEKRNSNIRAYRPPSRLPGPVHIVCGQSWLDLSQNVWHEEFLEDAPIVHNLGEVSHLDVVEVDHLIDHWIAILNQLLAAKTT